MDAKGLVVAVTAVAVGCFGASPALGTASHGGGGSRLWDSGWHDPGLIRLNITNYGRHGYENACEWPAGSGQTYIFGAGIWVGCISAGDTLVTVGYNPIDGSSEFVPGDLPNEPGYSDTTDRIYWSDDPADLAEWPVTDPSGDPVVISTLDSWCQFNDLDSTAHVAGDTRPIGVKVTQTGYSWNYPAYEDFVFLTYEVENVSGVGITDMYLGVACDADVGDYLNDLVGFDASRNLGYAFTQRPPGADVAGYIGYDFLESPLDSTGQQLGLTAFKIFTNQGVPPDPTTDIERYLVLAGYNHQTGVYDPFDAIETPTDIRFVQCTGPFALPPGDIARVVVAIIAGADTTDLFLNSDVAQTVYDNGFATHSVTVLAPNGGEVLSGAADIMWETVSGTGNPLTVDLFYSRDRGSTWNDIAEAEPDDSVYSWDTSDAPDGTWNMVRVTVTDGILVGEDTSDSLFTINNPGNGVPDVLLLSPNVGQISGTAAVEWEAADPDGDSLSISLYYGTDPDWTSIVELIPNAGVYDWNSYEAINGTYYLRVVASDGAATNEDLSDYQVTVFNQHDLYTHASHVHGGCNTVTVLPYVHIAEDTTGHTYRVEFNLIAEGNQYQPVYSYDLFDETSGELLLDDEALSTVQDGNLYTDWSPLFDGLSLKIDSQVDRTTFHYVDFTKTHNASGCDATLSINAIGSSYYWAFRGADFELRWQAASGDSLTLEVWDLTNDVAVPYAAVRGDNWAFAQSATDLYPTYRPGVDRMIWVCGAFFVFDLQYGMSIPPQPGDLWTITASGDHVPCAGNAYVFGPGTGSGDPSGVLPQELVLGPSTPNPVTDVGTIRYAVPRDGRITIGIYDLQGRQVCVLVDAVQRAGQHHVRWAGADQLGRDVGPGLYVCTLRAGDLFAARRVVVVR